MADRSPSPIFLVRCVLAGALLATASWFFAITPVRHPHDAGHGIAHFLATNWFRILSVLGPMTIGLLVGFIAESRFKKAYTQDLWTDAELAPVRRLLQRSFWTWGTIFILIACVATLIFRKTLAGGGFVYILIYPFNFATRIRTLISPPIKRNGELIDWRNSKPLQSEHWGQ